MVMEHRIWAEMDERSDFVKIPDSAFMGIDPVEMGAFPHSHIGELGIRPIMQSLPITVFPWRMVPGYKIVSCPTSTSCST